ncbi:arylsulfatase [Fibrisoma montanum]|uniref:arylsulfatase n=1 Tax=Fibrisoma montanum TaxID=2305895 RepID=UPI001E30ADD2|nr:arylsulfatase [Fibrisoma montanum]
MATGLWYGFTPAHKPARRPNVLFILTDDQGYGDLQLHGNRYLETPNIDLIGREGARFNRFYVSPLCAPSRASFLTGRYHLRTGVVSVSNGLEVMKASEVTLAELLQRYGYRTGCFGKWHNGEHLPNHPNGQGFEEFVGFCAGHWSNYFDTELDHNGKPLKTKGYISDVLTDRAIEFIRKNRDQPFFCYVPFNTPHSPHQVADRYFNPYKAKGLSDELASVYGMVQNMDENIGRLLGTLAELGIDEETIVVFSTDNGPNGNRFNAGMKGIKGSVDEGGVRVPFFVRWPGKIRPQLIRPIAAHIDLVPTLTDLLALPAPKTAHYDGISLADQLLGRPVKTAANRVIFTHVAQLARELSAVPAAIRSERFRWVKTARETALYDMQADSLQTTNIAHRYPDTLRAFEELYTRWFSTVSAATNPGSRPTPIGEGRRQQVLPAHEAQFTGQVRFNEGHGWAHDWLTNWQTPTDSIWWEVTSRHTKRYAVGIQYTCPPDQTGSVVRISTTTSTRQATLAKAYDPPTMPSPDRVPRKEAYEKPWAVMPVGIITIGPGEQRLMLTAPKVAGKRVADVKGIVLSEIVP